jgi:hypothetical protein
LLDPLGVGASAPVAAVPVAAGRERLRVLFGLGVVAVAVAVVWAALTAGGSEPDGSEDASGAEEGSPGDVGSSTSAPTTVSTTTQPVVPGSTEPVGPMVGYANGVAGPVLGPGVEGVVVAVSETNLSRLDLATGAVESIDLEWPVDFSGFSVVIDGEMVATSTGSHLVSTDLRTGGQGGRIEVGGSELGFGDARVIGRAGPESVWLAGYQTSDTQSTAVEVDLDGTVLRRLELDPAFFAFGALGRIVYLSGPVGAWRYDTEADTSEPIGILGSAGGEQIVVVSCQPTLGCEALIETESGLEPIPGLSSTDLVNGTLQLSPDQRRAVITGYGSGGQPTFTHVDLVTGRQTDLGTTPIEPYAGVVWAGDGAWMIGRGAVGQGLVAIDVATVEAVFIDLPDGADAFAADPYETSLWFLPPA